MKILTILLVTITTALATPGAAYASGCQATSSGSAVYVDGMQHMNAGISCSSLTGNTYEIRIYLQGSSGGWHSVHVPTPLQVRTTPNTATYYRLWSVYESCSYLTGADDYVRIKTVIENLNTGSTDTAYSGANTNPQICQ